MSRRQLANAVVKANAAKSVVTAGSSHSRAVRESTSRALILRNGKQGAMGTGELIAVNKISGREKLEILADDYMSRAVRARFDMETALKIARAALDYYLDDISCLQSVDLCKDMIEAEFKAYKFKDQEDLLLNPRWIAEQFASRVHNSFMLASAWRLVVQGLRELERMGLRDDKKIRNQLLVDGRMRTIYFVVFKLVEDIVKINQGSLAYIAHFTPHYAPFFKDCSDTESSEVEFEWGALKEVYKSFLDSIVIELCLPGSKYPPTVLFSCLNESAAESPKELKRFPQVMWDAVGDFADAIRIRDLLESPLLTFQGQTWRATVPVVPIQVSQWEEAQLHSLRVSKNVSTYIEFMSPLSNLQSRSSLDKLWAAINANYITMTGLDLDGLWLLGKSRKRSARWTPLTVPRNVLDVPSDSDGDDALLKSVVPKTKGPKKTRNPLAITGGDDDYSDLPGLESASDSSDEEESSDNDYDDRSVVDSLDLGESEEEDEDVAEEMKRMQRDIAEVQANRPEILEPPPDGNDSYAEERKKNPFITLLGNLRGRVFSSGAARKSNNRTKPEKPQPDWQKGQSGDAFQNWKRGEPAVQSQQTTVEDVVEDDEGATKADKKKKKKKPKKKKKTDAGDLMDIAEDDGDEDELDTMPPMIAEAKSMPSTPSKSKKQPISPSKAQPKMSSVSGSFGSSTATLPLQRTETAQSAHAYLKAEKLIETKVKVKSRPEEPPKQVGVLSRRHNEPEREEKPKVSMFAHVSKKTISGLKKLIGGGKEKKGRLRWEHFEKLMKDMGFTVDPSTAGSSVRFDPPNPKDESITFHKGHPDSTLEGTKLKQFGTRLRNKYGWTEDKLAAAVEASGRGKVSPADDDYEIY